MMRGVQVTIASEYPTVQIVRPAYTIPEIPGGRFADISSRLALKLTAGAGYFAPARLLVSATYDGWQRMSESVDILIAPDRIPEPEAVEILDGPEATFKVFHQKGNQGGGSSVERTVTEGKGNGNGILEPGEQATVW